MLFTDLVQVQLRSISDGNGPPTRFEAVRPCLRRCFNIKLKHPDMELVVGTQVSVSMLLKLGFIEFEEITLTLDGDPEGEPEENRRDIHSDSISV